MVLFVGELLADMITEEIFDAAEHFELKIGGSPGNIARYLAQLGIPTRILSKVGNDIIGERIIDKLSQNGVDTKYIQIDNFFGTTLVFVQKTPGSPDFFVLRGADRFLELPSEDIFQGIKILHLSCWPISFSETFEKTISIVEKAINSGISMSFDPNCRDKIFECGKITKDRINYILKHTTYSKPSLDDAIAIFGDVDYPLEDAVRYYIGEFHKVGVKNVVLTAGKYGAYASDGAEIVHIPSYAKIVVDATGAGDGFWTGMYYGILNGKDFVQSCIIGSKVAAYILGFVGADVELNKDILED